jgi:PhnB protein
MIAVQPYIAFPGNCREAIEFYKDALGAEVLFTQTVGESPMPEMGPAQNIMHCTMKVGESILMMSDDMSPEGPSATPGIISLTVALNDPVKAAAIFARLADGGAVMMPLEKTYWAEAFGMLADRFGIRWMINCDAPK